MKMLFLLTQLESGGAQTRVVQTVELLRSQGVEADLAFLYEKRTCFEDIKKIILAKRKGGGATNLLGAVIELAKMIRREKYDVIVTNTAPSNIIGNSVAWLMGVRTRIAYQTQPPARVSSAYRLADQVVGSSGIYTKNIVNSEWTKACFDAYPRAYRARLNLLYDGITPPPSSGSRAAARRALGIEQDRYIVLNVGRLSPQKDQQTLIRAMANVDGQLLIAGDGELKEDLTNLANSTAPGKVSFLGEISRETLGLYLSAADVFAFSSRWETFGLALVEASAYGLPLVVTDLPVSQEVLRVNRDTSNTSKCIFINPGDSTGFENALNVVRSAGEMRPEIEPKVSSVFTIGHHTSELLKICEIGQRS